MSKDEAWEECLHALRMVHQDRCVKFDCGCEKIIKEIKEALYV